jgi:hypothetical protein
MFFIRMVCSEVAVLHRYVRLHQMESKVSRFREPSPYWRHWCAVQSSDESDSSSLITAGLTFLSKYPSAEVLSPEFLARTALWLSFEARAEVEHFLCDNLSNEESDGIEDA